MADNRLEGKAPIARIWRGETRVEHADEYLAFLRRTGVADYRAVAGNRGVFVLRRIRGDRAEFLLLTLWESEEAIARFAGENIERARYYPDDAKYLLGFPPNVDHYECAWVEP